MRIIDIYNINFFKILAESQYIHRHNFELATPINPNSIRKIDSRLKQRFTIYVEIFAQH
jgi:hypothetical protein